MVGFPPYYKPTYAWEPLPASYDLHPMSFSPTVLQHTGSMYGNHVGRGAQPQQPLDCSTHYSPTSNTYHCITCDKVSISRSTSAGVFFFPQRGKSLQSCLRRDTPSENSCPSRKTKGVLHISRIGGPRQEVPQRDEAVWLQRLQEDLRPRRQPGAAHECSFAGSNEPPPKVLQHRMWCYFH